ncbi:hypothetical protein Nepgr_005102 [Nepenthes gracilis]|uniref:Uncharacterized protein n=1 Tax=Nepenthes gracilis TaxID=150966 RepID=A0AAD3S2N9_NEPGR|nr:hypothetical protein Nepgr_005102 [Nepenthes gracilis]
MERKNSERRVRTTVSLEQWRATSEASRFMQPGIGDDGLARMPWTYSLAQLQIPIDGSCGKLVCILLIYLFRFGDDNLYELFIFLMAMIKRSCKPISLCRRGLSTKDGQEVIETLFAFAELTSDNGIYLKTKLDDEASLAKQLDLFKKLEGSTILKEEPVGLNLLILVGLNYWKADNLI